MKSCTVRPLLCALRSGSVRGSLLHLRFHGGMSFPSSNVHGAAVRSALSTAVRFNSGSSVPTKEEVLQAYTVLGVSTTSTFADVKRKYVDLAKQHHPDVNLGASNTTTRMVDINNAYSTVNRFHKAGHTLPLSSSSQQSSSSTHGYRGAGGRSTASGTESYYTEHDARYQPWHEDLDPLMYEMMWEEMRRQNDADAAAAAADFYDTPYGHWQDPSGARDGAGRSQRSRWRPQNQRNQRHTSSHTQQQQRERNGEGQGGQNRRSTTTTTSDNNTDSEEQQKAKTTWPEADLKALINMYEDGKSFEFIANALGKEVGAVVGEFNRWRETQTSSRGPRSSKQRSNTHYRQQQQQYSGGRRRRQRSYRPASGPYYHAEYPENVDAAFFAHMMGAGGMDLDDEVLDGYDEYDDAEEEELMAAAAAAAAAGQGYDPADPYGYYNVDDPYNYPDGGGTIPFTGTVHMSGGGRPRHSRETAYNKKGGGGGGGGSDQRSRQRPFQQQRNNGRPPFGDHKRR